MNWFKTIKLANAMLAQTIAVWLDQAGRGNLNMQGLDADINQIMAGVTDANMLEQAINAGIEVYRKNSRNSGPLLPAQDELINNLKRRFTNPPGQQPRPMGPVNESFPSLPEPGMQEPAVEAPGVPLDSGTGESNV